MDPGPITCDADAPRNPDPMPHHAHGPSLLEFPKQKRTTEVGGNVAGSQSPPRRLAHPPVPVTGCWVTTSSGRKRVSTRC
uniref:Uncharacterized protein n=1 Tax=Nymphaea colorata TaxID=210225 RepID=A0A5K0WTX2_9MAGN